MPSSPCEPGTNSTLASPENICPSALTMSTCMDWAMMDLPRSAQRLRFFDRFLDAADHVERLLGEMVVLAGNDVLEAADRILQGHDFAVLAGEHLRHVEGLRQEAL